MDSQIKVIAQVIQERKMQDRQWGGAEHDDTHSVSDWFDYIYYQYRNSIAETAPEQFRARFVKIAALAVAAIESLDRKNVHN